MENRDMRTEAKPITDRTFEFAISVVKLAQKIDKQSGASTVMAKQLLRSGTSIGANVDKTKEGQGRLRRDHAVEEAQGGQSRADFISKMSIALKEARETLYWLRLLAATEIEGSAQLAELTQEANEIVSILVAIVKNTKQGK